MRGNWFLLVFALAFLGMTAHFIRKGEFIIRGYRAPVRRDTSPRLFWFAALFFPAIGLLFLAIAIRSFF